MCKTTNHCVATFLVLSALMLAVLVPGGPIETRSFSHIPLLVLSAFNTFLTTLGMISLALAFFVVKGRKWAAVASALCGAFYFIVYALDLAGLFPVSPDKMPETLMLIEIAGAIVSIPLFFFSAKLASALDSCSRQGETASMPRYWLLIALAALMGLGIIVFATNAAMR